MIKVDNPVVSDIAEEIEGEASDGSVEDVSVPDLGDAPGPEPCDYPDDFEEYDSSEVYHAGCYFLEIVFINNNRFLLVLVTLRFHLENVHAQKVKTNKTYCI